MTQPKRKLEHWLATFRDWTSPRVHVEESYIIWSGLFALSAALKRRIWIPQSTLGAWDCYPYLYLMLVGPPGYGKTTTLRLASEIFEDIPSLKAAPTSCHVAVLAKRINESDDKSIYVIAEEFGEFVAKSGLDMYDFLNGAFDGKKKMEIETIARGIEYSEAPCITFAAGTTLKWIAERLPEEVIGGGFAARFLFVYADKYRFKNLFREEGEQSVEEWIKMEQMKADLTHDLFHIATELTGEVKLDKAAKDLAQDIYISTTPEKYPEKIQSYYRRRHVHMLKVAMLWHVSYSDELVLNRDDIENANAILQTTEVNLPRIFSGLGKNKYTMDSRNILEYIRANEQVSKQVILSEFEAIGNIDDLERILKHLTMAGKIKISMGHYVAV